MSRRPAYTDDPSPASALESGLPRREFLKLGTGLAVSAGLALSPTAIQALVLRRDSPGAVPVEYDLHVRRHGVSFTGRDALGFAINDSIPGPMLRFREGDDVVIRVTNHLEEVTSIHWHGLLVPADQDGVPDFSYDGIAPRETFTYRFRVRQAGTYWYHSHSGGQEQQGMYAPLVIDPADDPVAYDREHTVILSDWTDEDPFEVLRNLKGNGGYYNYGRRTLPQLVGGLFSEPGATIRDREAWGRMRMDPTDIADVTGATYTFLLNGQTSADNWTGLFRPGERVRLRFINAAAMTYFDVKIPGLPMTVVQADGQDVEPVEVDEFRIAVAETYDVVVEPGAGEAYTLFAQAMDRSGFVRGTLAEAEPAEAPIPELDPRPVRTMMDMPGMNMSDMDMPGMDMPREDMPGTDMAAAAGTPETDHGAMDHAAMGHTAMSGTRTLDYADLRALTPNADVRDPEREIVIRLTGDMERYFWTLNGKKSGGAEAFRLRVGERAKLVLVNETMMEHPMHLHGVFMELQNGQDRAHAPRKHTISVPPGQSVEAHLTFQDEGPWAFHCHLLFHMKTGMFGRFEVTDMAAEEES